MMTVVQKLAIIEANRKRMEALLEGTTFKLVHCSVGAPILRTTPNPHAYVIFDTELQTVISGLKVFLAFTEQNIACLECWKALDDITKRETLACVDEKDAKSTVKFIRSKRKMFAKYLKKQGIVHTNP